jgi:hypothetical protein
VLLSNIDKQRCTGGTGHGGYRIELQLSAWLNYIRNQKYVKLGIGSVLSCSAHVKCTCQNIRVLISRTGIEENDTIRRLQKSAGKQMVLSASGSSPLRR